VLSHGYGLKSLTHSLVRTFERLSKEPLTAGLHETIHGFARTIAEQPVQLLPLVDDTLQYLAKRHQLIMVTKGDHSEQSGKVTRSGLERHFVSVEIVPEKTTQHYRELVERHSLPAQRTWMVGNSPKSDINPALAAGLNAVFVPHNDTWVLEHEELAQAKPPAKLLVLNSFAELAQHF
jgi:putative hydrolase of the HAD superfamily